MRLIFLALILVACSKSEPTKAKCAGSPLLGQWHSSNDTLTYNDDCTGSSQYCQNAFTYSSWQGLTAASSPVDVTSAPVNDPTCPPVMRIYCDYEISGSNLDFDCGNGATHYER